MELMWLVYAVENLTYNGSFFMVLFWTIIIAICFCGGFSLLIGGLEKKMDTVLNFWRNIFPTKTVTFIMLILLTLHTLIPSRDTAIKMAGAYLIQTVVTSDKANKLGDAAYRATLRQLEKWAAEVPELNEMVQDMNNDLKVEEGK